MVKPSATNFPLTGKIRLGTGVNKTSMPSSKFIDFNTYQDQIQLKYDGDDVAFIGFFIEVYVRLFEIIKKNEYGKRNWLTLYI